MSFNSYIFLFLPITLLGFHLIGSQGRHRVSLAWLVAASIFFYGWWSPAYLGLILGSMLFNYAVGGALNSAPASPPPPKPRQSWSPALPPILACWATTSMPTSSLTEVSPF